MLQSHRAPSLRPYARSAHGLILSPLRIGARRRCLSSRLKRVQPTPPSWRASAGPPEIDSSIKEQEEELRKLEVLPVKDTRYETLAFWVGSAMAFGAGIWFVQGPVKAQEYFAGYLLGKLGCHISGGSWAKHGCVSHTPTLPHCCASQSKA